MQDVNMFCDVCSVECNMVLCCLVVINLLLDNLQYNVLHVCLMSAMYLSIAKRNKLALNTLKLSGTGLQE